MKNIFASLQYLATRVKVTIIYSYDGFLVGGSKCPHLVINIRIYAHPPLNYNNSVFE